MDQGSFSDFMAFRTLISTAWIKVVYAIGAGLITLGSVAFFLGLANNGEAGTGFIGGAIYFVAGNIIWRMACEFVILFFSMHEQLVKLTKLQSAHANVAARPVGAVGTTAIARPSALETSPAGLPQLVSDTYERWVEGDATAYADFIRHLAAAMPVLPDRFSPAFLRNCFQAASGTPEFEALLEGRS